MRSAMDFTSPTDGIGHASHIASYVSQQWICLPWPQTSQILSTSWDACSSTTTRDLFVTVAPVHIIVAQSSPDRDSWRLNLVPRRVAKKRGEYQLWWVDEGRGKVT